MEQLLLVEDDKQLAGMYSKKFKQEGFEVTIATTGSDGIQVAKEGDFDIIVLDLMLPGISGVDVLEILRSDERTVKTPVIIYTNFGDQYNRERCLTYGADEFVFKVDSTPESLCETIKRVLIIKNNEEV